MSSLPYLVHSGEYAPLAALMSLESRAKWLEREANYSVWFEIGKVLI
jgi:hypothetical protein